MIGHRTTTWILGAVLLIAALSLLATRQAVPAQAAPAAAPTPGVGAMTVYAVTNAQPVPIDVQHVFADGTGFSYSFWSQVPAGSTATYHVRDIPEVPSPFNGSINFYSDQPFTAQVTGYDYPGTPAATAPPASPPPSSTPPASATATPTGTATASATATPSATPTLAPAATDTATPSATPTVGAGAVLFADGFEEGSFAAGGWTPAVAGSGSTAQLVGTPVHAGAQAARFGTQTQQEGEQALVEHDYAWPAAQVVAARAFLQPQASAIQYASRVLGLETRGPGDWVVRAAFALGPRTFGVLYTTQDGQAHYADLGLAYQPGQWYELALTADYRGASPTLQFQIGGQVVYRVVDPTAGPSTDRPVALCLGFAPVAWGANSGAVVLDDALVWDPSQTSPADTPTAAVPAPASPTTLPTWTATATPTVTGPATVTSTATVAPTWTPNPTNTPTVGAIATSSATMTGTPSLTATPSSTATIARTATPTVTRAPTKKGHK